MQFETLAKAESWIHSPEGKDAIEEIMTSYKK
jgi:antibiotic biosynthesis monooxygenase (ABM) superfamily enzyme